MSSIKQLFEEIMRLSDADAASELSNMSPGIAHQIYRLARDGHDIVVSGIETFRGQLISTAVIDFLKQDLFIQAIKQCRIESGLGLKEAKDLCEAYRTERIWARPPAS